MTDDEAMRLALAEAAAALDHGDVPVGAVSLVGGEVVASRHNERQLRADPSAHAELLALRDTARRLGDWRLGDVTLVVTLEPCPMCAGALVNARVARVVYGCADPKAGAITTMFGIGTDERLNHRLEVVSGVLAEECAARLTAFFRALRGSLP